MPLYIGRISQEVAALEQELEYYRKLSKEQQEIIEQLHRGYPLPGKEVYIHPYDMAEILNNLSVSDLVMSYQPTNLITVKGTHYKQHPSMPQITKNIR